MFGRIFKLCLIYSISVMGFQVALATAQDSIRSGFEDAVRSKAGSNSAPRAGNSSAGKVPSTADEKSKSKRRSSDLSLSQRCVVLVRNRHYKLAIEECTEAAKSGDDLAGVSLALCQAHFLLRQYQAATRSCSQAIATEDSRGLPYYYRCAALNALGRFEQAVSDCTDSLKRDSERAEAYAERGYAERLLGNFSEARADLETARDMFFRQRKLSLHAVAVEQLLLLSAEEDVPDDNLFR